jgi:hydroxymethylpyrimidine/phosphomethylpyrimidine kinase
VDRGDAARVTQRTPIALTIAGSDSGGGAGVQADLKTFSALGVYGASAITALTAQNTLGVRAIHAAPPEIVRAEIDAVLDDFCVAAIKIGMLANAAIVEAVADALGSRLLTVGEGRPFIVYDPVLAASSGEALAGAGFVAAVKSKLLPLVDCLTPNIPEAARLLDEPAAQSEADLARQGRELLALGPRAVLMKGGHLDGAEAVDLLVTADRVLRFAAPRIASPNTHGTGCTLSAAIAAYVVRGLPLAEAVAAAKFFVSAAIERALSAKLGAGAGPLLQTAPFASADPGGQGRGR